MIYGEAYGAYITLLWLIFKLEITEAEMHVTAALALKRKNEYLKYMNSLEERSGK